ncbi:hypothetical protein [Mucilaginibacter sp. NFX135]|uniref:hypothetical protein n=1 Tax=Mucilaginibacter sp. NFX135 TaxID=3402687 RepID=UPI003AFA6663
METTPANTKDTQKGKLPNVQKKPDEPRVKTVTPDNDSGNPGAPAQKDSPNVQKDSSNVDKGPKGENL